MHKDQSSYIKRFSRVFRTKIQRKNALKVKQASEMKFLSGKWILGVKTHVNLLTFTAGRQTAGFHVLDSMWTTSRACAVAFKSSRSLPVVVHSPRRPRCLRSLFSLYMIMYKSPDISPLQQCPCPYPTEFFTSYI